MVLPAWSGDCEWPVCHSDSSWPRFHTPACEHWWKEVIPVHSRKKPGWKTAGIKGFVYWKENGKQKRVTVFQWPLGHSLGISFQSASHARHSPFCSHGSLLSFGIPLKLSDFPVTFKEGYSPPHTILIFETGSVFAVMAVLELTL